MLNLIQHWSHSIDYESSVKFIKGRISGGKTHKVINPENEADKKIQCHPDERHFIGFFNFVI